MKKKTYYKNGQEDEIENYKNGDLNGARKTYYESGKKKEIQTYENDKKVKELSYFENGELKNEITYIGEKILGKYQYSNEDKSRIETENYNEQGEKHGKWKSIN